MNSIPRMAFKRLCKEVFQEFGNYRLKPEALDALQMISEEYLVELFDYARLCATHAKRVTIMPKDLQLAIRFISARPISERTN